MKALAVQADQRRESPVCVAVVGSMPRRASAARDGGGAGGDGYGDLPVGGAAGGEADGDVVAAFGGDAFGDEGYAEVVGDEGQERVCTSFTSIVTG